MSQGTTDHAIPSQYLSQVTSSYTAYLLADSPSLRATCLSVLMVWLNRCSTIVGHPVQPRPYPDPPVSPSVVTQDDGEGNQVMTGDLHYQE